MRKWSPAFLLLAGTICASAAERVIPCSPDFVQLVDQGQVQGAELITTGRSGETYLVARLKTGESVRVDLLPSDPVLQRLLTSGGAIKITKAGGAQVPSFLPRVVIGALWIALAILILLLFVRIAEKGRKR